jgi:valyl-tRNA synthetase
VNLFKNSVKHLQEVLTEYANAKITSMEVGSPMYIQDSFQYIGVVNETITPFITHFHLEDLFKITQNKPQNNISSFLKTHSQLDIDRIQKKLDEVLKEMANVESKIRNIRSDFDIIQQLKSANLTNQHFMFENSLTPSNRVKSGELQFKLLDSNSNPANYKLINSAKPRLGYGSKIKNSVFEMPHEKNF